MRREYEKPDKKSQTIMIYNTYNMATRMLSYSMHFIITLSFTHFISLWYLKCVQTSNQFSFNVERHGSCSWKKFFFSLSLEVYNILLIKLTSTWFGSQWNNITNSSNIWIEKEIQQNKSEKCLNVIGIV